MATAITIEQWRDQLARMVRTGAIKKGLQVAADSLAMHGARKAVDFASHTPGRPRGLGILHGNLVRSLAGEVKARPRSVDVVLSSGGKSGFGAVPYARRHEEGTHGMRKRPFLQPALVHISRQADEVISTKIQRVLEGRT
jgi:HK97 gp10 family phage protein